VYKARQINAGIFPEKTPKSVIIHYI